MKRKLLMLAMALLCSAGTWAQKDITSTYITNAKLTDSFNVGWTTTNFNGDHTQGNNTEGYAVESYAGWGSIERPTYSMKQNITLPAGSYRLVNYAFYRYGANHDTDATKSEAYLVAGENKTLIKTLGSIAGQAGYAGSMDAAANRFETKMYRNVVEFTIDADNTTISVGVEGTHSEPKSWFICGMFELFDLNDVASVNSPTDMTYAITNPGFEYLNLTGWNTENGSNNKSFWYMDNTVLNGKSGVAWVETYEGGGIGTGRSIYQDLTGIDNGLYEVTVYGHLQQGSGSDGFYLYANNDKVAIGSTDQDYSVRTTVTNGNLRIKLGTENCNGNWAAFDKVRLKFYGDPLDAYKDLLAAAVNGAQALINGDAGSAISSTAKAEWKAVVDNNDNDDNAFTEESQFTTAIANIEAANTNYQAMAAPYASFNALKTAANAIAAVAYTETTNGSHTTFTDAISAQTTAADAALTATDITTATDNLISAIKTYIAGAEPANDGEYFDITCLMTNPNFDDSHNGWTFIDAPGVNWSNCEYYEKEFDINQTVTGLPTGSYSLCVQAFQRPGWAGGVYNDYTGGTDNASSVLYINSITSNVKNIAADAQDTYKLGDGSSFDWPNDSRVGTEGNYKYLPNSQQGSKLYFDAGLYDATCAAVVTDADGGSLKLGFKSTKTHVAGDWTIFDNFRLYYYGSSLLVYYKQYLPQLKAEANADLSNALYNNVQGVERSDFSTALVADPAYETEAAYKAVIDDIIEKQAAFRSAASSYDALVAAKAQTQTKISANIGTGIFQYNATTNDNLFSVYETAKSDVDNYTVTTSSTAAEIQLIVDAFNNAVEDYNNQALNAPDADEYYYIKVATSGHAKNGNAILVAPGSITDNNPTGYTFSANMNPAVYLNQAFKFVSANDASHPNRYYITTNVKEGTLYLTNGDKNGSTAGHKLGQIQGTTNADNKMAFDIAGTTTDNVFNIVNPATGGTIACQPGGNIYTESGNADFTLAEATQASVTVSAKAGKFGTTIIPFTPDVTTGFEGIKFYSITSADDAIELEEVSEPAANVPYLIKNSGSDNFTKNLEGWGTAGEDSYKDSNNCLTGVYTTVTIPASAGNTINYVLQTQNGEQKFYKVTSDFTATAYKAYLTVDSGTGAKSLGFNIDEGQATGIDNIVNILNADDAVIYNAAGARQNGLQKGLNIIRTKDGKVQKVLVK